MEIAFASTTVVMGGWGVGGEGDQFGLKIRFLSYGALELELDLSDGVFFKI